MTAMQHPNRLHTQLAYMVALEAAIGEKLEEVIPEVSIHDGVTTLLNGFLRMSRAQRQALETRLQTMADGVPFSEGTKEVLATHINPRAINPVSTALQIVYTILNQAIMGYAILHSLSTRFLDSGYVADEGTSFHLARQHTQNYVQAVRQVAGLLHDVVLWELDQEGVECACVCPSCGAGICLCAMAGRSFLRDTWIEAGTIPADEGVFVQRPKKNSAASKAGLQRGDVIIAAEGRKIESFGDLQSVVRNAEPGQGIRLTVRRNPNLIEETTIIRP